jgi:hypothetical protein
MTPGSERYNSINEELESLKQQSNDGVKQRV